MMKETGWQRSEVSRRVTTVLVVEDLTLAPYLPLLTTLVAGAGAIAGFLSVSFALLVTAIALIISFKGENALGKILNTQAQGGLLLTVFGAALLAAGHTLAQSDCRQTLWGGPAIELPGIVLPPTLDLLDRDDAMRVMRASYPNSEYLAQGFKRKSGPWWKLW